MLENMRQSPLQKEQILVLKYEESKKYFLSLSEKEQFKIIEVFAAVIGKNLAFGVLLSLQNEEFDIWIEPKVENIIGTAKTKKEFFTNKINLIIQISEELFEGEVFYELYDLELRILLKCSHFLHEVLYGDRENEPTFRRQFEVSLDKSISDYKFLVYN